MKKVNFVFEDGDHKWAMVARDPEKPDYLIDTNEYLVMNGEQAILTDPGDDFPHGVFRDQRGLQSDNINGCLHQDPDIISSPSL